MSFNKHVFTPDKPGSPVCQCGTMDVNDVHYGVTKRFGSPPIANLQEAEAEAKRDAVRAMGGNPQRMDEGDALMTKPTNPKEAVGIAKPPVSTISHAVIGELGLAMMEGARKYGRHNYRPMGVRASVYIDALYRHVFLQWWEGEDIDEESGISHITKAIATLMVLRDSMIQGNWTDDRPPKTPAGFYDELKKKAEEIIAKYPKCKEAFTQEKLNAKA